MLTQLKDAHFYEVCDYDIIIYDKLTDSWSVGGTRHNQKSETSSFIFVSLHDDDVCHHHSISSWRDRFHAVDTLRNVDTIIIFVGDVLSIPPIARKQSKRGTS